MGIVVRKQAMDYQQMNTAINPSLQSTFAARLNEIISSAAIQNVQFKNTSDGGIYFKADASAKKNVVGCVVEIDKQ